ncbi:uncharacterized protein FSUBG_11100 [Fusarium subglutinans]|uniref:2EXR domain-containing protein n=1 Tax=Gibberella subglutinans TaxID=42677 RepID=A0A8H5P6D3_GIBSU|nr:uncharacterized protein FSUBG_11100 [Fusarium subglutinans]KAF5589675.1 hypothetical protein FSUBG_11100 [Fusarium subglutinans]
MASFARFAQLPKELRDMVWEYASQRDVAGVQIFELRPPEPTEDGETSDATTSGARPPRQQLAAPLRSKCFPSIDGGPGDSNVSRYMADIGLWTACKESREVMEKTTQRTNRIPERGARQEYRFNWGDLPSDTSQPFMVQLHKDLIVLQPSKIEDINWSQIAHDIGEHFDPRYSWHGINIGIEWKVQWGINKEDDDFNLLCQAFHDLDAQLWIIDHNLKRKEDMDKNKTDGGTEAFYTCDRKFLEVDWRHKPFERWRHVRPPPAETRYGKPECSTSLAKGLDCIEDDSHSRYILYGQYGEEGDDRFMWQIRLLGWDDL